MLFVVATAKWGRAMTRGTRASLVATITVLVVTLAVGIAYSVIPDSTGVIHACMTAKATKNGTHSVKLLDTAAASTCPKGWTPVSWNATGPQGEPGPPGSIVGSACVKGSTPGAIVESVDPISGVVTLVCATNTGTTTTSTTSTTASTSTTTTTVPCTGTGTWKVDVVNGSDSNTGTCGSAFKTLTKAFSVAKAGDEVVAAPGTYDAANGEVTPLTVPASVSVVGDAASSGTSPLTEIAGDITVSTHGILDGFTLVGHVTLNGLAILEFDTMSNGGTSGGTCADVAAGASATLDRLTISNCNIGIEVLGSASLGQSSVTGNKFGVDIESTGVADLGGGAFSSIGGNVLSCNLSADIFDASTSALSASSDLWDHVPPTQSPGISGADIVVTAGASVIANNGAVATNHCA
jgi:hypothetical protein